MKILWLVNTPLVKIKKQLGENGVTTGGWLEGISSELLKQKEIDLFVLFPYNKIVKGEIDNLKFASFVESDDLNQAKIYESILQTEKPSVIHVFGTEFKHTLNFVKVCEKLNLLDKTVVSIQGLCSVYANHYFAGLPNKISNGKTLKEIIRGNSLKSQKQSFITRGENEIKALQIAKNVIGRTDWDKACSLQINPKLNYYFCNETLRDTFYKNNWDFDKCKKHSIFVSQAYYPIKGFHKVLEAMPEILKQFPDAKVFVTGKDLTNNLSFKEKLRLGSYEKYLRRLIADNNLTDKIISLGMLDEEKMCKAYLNANVFVSASSIENSPNSVGEAMLLGTPVVSSDVGGVKNMLKHDEEGFVYPFDESYMLAHYVCELFKNKNLQIKFSENAKKHAAETHSKEKNLKQLLSIYKKLIGEK